MLPATVDQDAFIKNIIHKETEFGHLYTPFFAITSAYPSNSPIKSIWTGSLNWTEESPLQPYIAFLFEDNSIFIVAADEEQTRTNPFNIVQNLKSPLTLPFEYIAFSTHQRRSERHYKRTIEIQFENDTLIAAWEKKDPGFIFHASHPQKTLSSHQSFEIARKTGDL
jgi:hypothetical protein